MIEIQINTALNWLALGAIWVIEQGEENTYYVDQFDIRYFCKTFH